MLDILVDIGENSESDSARVSATKEILDRALGKAPQHVDITALRHTKIVYRSAEEIRQALADLGVPPVLLDYVPPNKDDKEKEDEDRGAED
jgi:hypothetical protein